MTIGERIKIRRIELNMSQDELAKKMGYKTRNAVYQFEQKDNMKLSLVSRFAKALDTTESYLMGWEEEEEQNGAILGRIALNPELMNHVKKLMSLSPEQQGIVFNQIDYLYDKTL